MSRNVFCKKYQQELEGLDAPPYPGPKGQEIFDSISKQAWLDWQAHQTMLSPETYCTVHPSCVHLASRQRSFSF